MIKYYATAQIGDVTVSIENEVGSVAEALAEVAQVSASINDRVLPAPAAPLLGPPIVADPAVPKGEVHPVSGSETVVFEAPTVDAVADAVKLVVSKHGVARAAALLKEHGGARAADVPAENRAAFIEAAQKAVAA